MLLFEHEKGLKNYNAYSKSTPNDVRLYSISVNTVSKLLEKPQL